MPAVAKLSGATVSKVEGSLAVATLLSAIPGVDGDSDEFKDFYTKAKDAADLAEDIYDIENPPSSESDDEMTSEELALFITVPLVTFILCCVLPVLPEESRRALRPSVLLLATRRCTAEWVIRPRVSVRLARARADTRRCGR
jgi:hypothetical protein